MHVPVENPVQRLETSEPRGGASASRDLYEYIDKPSLIHDSPYKVVHSVSLIDGLFRCKLQAFPEGTSCENPL